jgi:hypothetical protein
LAGRGEEDAEDPGGEESENGGEGERLGPRQRGARPGEVRLALLRGRRVVAGGAGSRRLDVTARERHRRHGGGAGEADGVETRRLLPESRGMSRRRPHGVAGRRRRDLQRGGREQAVAPVFCAVFRCFCFTVFLFNFVLVALFDPFRGLVGSSCLPEEGSDVRARRRLGPGLSLAVLVTCTL